jgi:hypothetical protein
MGTHPEDAIRQDKLPEGQLLLGLLAELKGIQVKLSAIRGVGHQSQVRELLLLQLGHPEGGSIGELLRCPGLKISPVRRGSGLGVCHRCEVLE